MGYKSTAQDGVFDFFFPSSSDRIHRTADIFPAIATTKR